MKDEDKLYRAWPWGWLQLDFEQVCEAAKTIDPDRNSKPLERSRVIELAGYREGVATPEELEAVFDLWAGEDYCSLEDNEVIDPREVSVIGHALAPGGHV